MISPDTVVSWIDIKTGKERTDAVQQLFQEYANDARMIEAGWFKIYFEEGAVKVKDWYGWTDLISIEIHQDTTEYSWHRITVGDKELVANGVSFIPIYNPHQSTAGFHGQQKHPYILAHVARIPKENAWLRVRYGSEDSDFAEVTRDEFLGEADYPNAGYDLCTKSGFVNANDIYIHASDDVNIEDVLKWN